MNKLKNILDMVLASIDNGSFFRTPMKRYYLLHGIIMFLVPIAYIFMHFSVVKGRLEYYETWRSIVLVLTELATVAWMFIAAYLSFTFWRKRADGLEKEVHPGSQIVLIPTFAHYVQCLGEWLGMLLTALTAGLGAIHWLGMLLSGPGEGSFGRYFENLLMGLCALGAAVLVAVFLSYAIVSLSHLMGEKLRIKAMMANDLRDVSDIQRASVM